MRSCGLRRAVYAAKFAGEPLLLFLSSFFCQSEPVHTSTRGKK